MTKESINVILAILVAVLYGVFFTIEGEITKGAIIVYIAFFSVLSFLRSL